MTILMIKAETAAGDIVQINLDHVISVEFAGGGSGTRAQDGPADKVRMQNNSQIMLAAGEWAAALQRLDDEYDTGSQAGRVKRYLYIGYGMP